VKLPKKLLIVMPVVVGLILVGIFMPARQVTIEGIGTLSFETPVTLSVGSEAAYASHSIAKVGTDTSGSGTSLTLPYSLSFSHTLVAGSDRMVVVCAGIENSDTIDVSSVTYGGVGMTKAVEGITGTTGFRYLAEIWYILEADLPSDGSNTVQINASGTAYELEVGGFCAEYTGVEQGAPEATDNTDEPSPADNTIENTISPSDNAWVISIAGSGNAGSFTHGQGQVEVLDFMDYSSTFAVAELRGASGETSLDSTFSGALNRLERVAASFTEVPPAPPEGPTYQSFAEASYAFDTTSITVSKPSGTASGDLLIGVIVTDGDAGTFTPPSGWTLINSGTADPGGITDQVTLGAWYKIAGGSEPPSYTWNWTNSQAVYAFIIRITGHDSSNPIHVWGVATGSSTGISITITCPDVTTTVDDTLVLRIFGSDRAMNFGSYPSGHTGIAFDSSSGDNTTPWQCTGGAAYKTQATAGATGTADFTAIPNVSATEEWRALTVVIAPPAAAPPDISNLPTSKNFGTVSENSSYWSNNGPPTFPLDDGECYFSVTNNSSGSVNISIRATNFNGGVGWTLAGSPGVNIVTLKAGKSGDNDEGAMVTLTDSDQGFISNLAESDSIDWELKLETGTFTDGAEKTSTITLTATFA
jgi:hypothetical protein